MICLSGKKRSGKDTAAKFMIEHGFKTYALANPIKWALHFAFKEESIDITMNQLNGVNGHNREESLGLTLNQIRAVLIEAFFYTMHDSDYTLLEIAKHTDKVVKFLEDIDNPEEFSIRKFMQVFGTDIMCLLVSDQHWLNLSEKYAPKNAVITDIRQPWEEKYFRDRNATFVFIKGAYPEYVESTDPHITEQGLTPQENDIVIINNELDTLSKEIKCLLTKLKN